MKTAVDILRPAMERERARGLNNSAGKVILATVKGDVHDIGKNIVGIVLACNNFEVIDLGVMVSAEEIVDAVVEHRPLMVGLSGLITPSLGEMVNVARALERVGDKTPLVVGGATTSLLHTALKIAPERANGAVIHSADAGTNAAIAANLANPLLRDSFLAENRRNQLRLVAEHENSMAPTAPSLEMCRRGAVTVVNPSPPPLKPGTTLFENISLNDIIPLINWRMFFHAWRMTGEFLDNFPYDLCDGCVANWEASLTDSIREKATNALSLYRDARRMLADWSGRFIIRGAVSLLTARRDGDDIIVDNRVTLPMLRELKNDSKSLADWITDDGRDWIGAFAVSAGVDDHDTDDDYNRVLGQTICDRLVEAASEWIHLTTRRLLWGYAADETAAPPEILRGEFRGIRPAVGYPSLPDQSLANEISLLLPLDKLQIEITENGALKPASSELGLYLAAPEAAYFNIRRLTSEQLEDYAPRRHIPLSRLRLLLARLVND